MHMLFQSEAAYRRRRSWMPRDGDDASASNAPPKLIGPRRPRDRGKSRSCRTFRREAKRRTQQHADNEPALALEDDGEDNQEEEVRDALCGEVHAMQMEIETLQQRRLLLDSAVVSARTNAVAHACDVL
ncbi:hypothetical protein PF005_g28370 [Phytophthora fragariae]|uniref:Uncharacterized protein n=1 Tax=Phytophthora fragariae TaxID=53985 RepID=A0A6A3QKM2_9STRA|nr:hypothetical protein PF003_g19934 [Phytophthora fragariae]KAE8920648.1 hypothetical protein PF009_g29064 [Phytophthora fragariae]KAE8967940.1 hypothetical protein PF011_g27378 [Phytophthora fragariae]KAE9066056.1 hypothetical protein PF010_g27960 [Phytophthora fragariae]KAE9066434.1 hypothetical protein PF007_g28471 [Phytophthora fragariae]